MKKCFWTWKLRRKKSESFARRSKRFYDFNIFSLLLFLFYFISIHTIKKNNEFNRVSATSKNISADSAAAKMLFNFLMIGARKRFDGTRKWREKSQSSWNFRLLLCSLMIFIVDSHPFNYTNYFLPSHWLSSMFHDLKCNTGKEKCHLTFSHCSIDGDDVVRLRLHFIVTRKQNNTQSTRGSSDELSFDKGYEEGAGGSAVKNRDIHL